MRRTIVAVVSAVVLAGCWPAPGQGPDRQSWNVFETGIDVGNAATLTEAWTRTVGWRDDAGVIYPERAGNPIVSNAGLVTITTPNSVRAFEASNGNDLWWSSQSGFAELFDTDVVASGDALLVGYGTDRSGWTTRWTGARGGGWISDMPTFGRGLSVRGERAAGTSVAPGAALSEAVVSLTAGSTATPADRWTGVLWSGPAAEKPLQYGVTLGTGQVLHAGPGLLSAAPGDGALGNGLRAFADRASGPSTCGPLTDAHYACPAWVARLDGTGATPPVLSSDRTVAFTVTDAGTAYAVDTATGAVRWSTPVGSAVAATPALADGSLFVPTASGSLVVLDAGDGSPSWSTAPGSGLTVQPAVAGGVVFTGAADGTVRAFDASGCGAPTCGDLWSAATGSRITGAPAVSLGTLFVGTEDGHLIAYAPAS